VIDDITPVVWMAAACSMLACLFTLLLVVRLRREARWDARVASVKGLHTPIVGQAGPRAPLPVRLVVIIGGWLIQAGLVPRRMLLEAEMMSAGARIAGASTRGEMAVRAIIGGKVLMVLLLPPLVWVLSGGVLDIDPLWPAVFGVIAALMIPDILLDLRRRRRVAAIEHGLPDALDLLSICVNASLSLDAALERTGREIASVHPAIAEEFRAGVIRLRLAQDQRTALTEFGGPFGSESLRRLTANLAQSIEVGVPLTTALKTLSKELRQRQAARFEAAASRLPVMLTIPLVLFFMPTVLLIVAGPAVLQLIRNFQ
jgi:tight adherence protein C